MRKAPTYTALEIKEMAAKPGMDEQGFRILAELIDEEISLYEPTDMFILAHASMMLFTRSLVSGWMRIKS